MSADLAQLAGSLEVNERTLRRAWALGAVRGERVTPYKLRIPVDERVYLRRHWPVIGGLRAALRTEPNVSLAVLFGSVARGDDDEESDVDVLVDLREPGLSTVMALARRLDRRTGLPLELVNFDDAMRRPALMVEILREGRVLVDRERRWPRLQAQAADFAAKAQVRRRLLAERAQSAAEMFARKAEALR